MRNPKPKVEDKAVNLLGHQLLSAGGIRFKEPGAEQRPFFCIFEISRLLGLFCGHPENVKTRNLWLFVFQVKFHDRSLPKSGARFHLGNLAEQKSQ